MTLEPIVRSILEPGRLRVEGFGFGIINQIKQDGNSVIIDVAGFQNDLKEFAAYIKAAIAESNIDVRVKQLKAGTSRQVLEIIPLTIESINDVLSDIVEALSGDEENEFRSLNDKLVGGTIGGKRKPLSKREYARYLRLSGQARKQVTEAVADPMVQHVVSKLEDIYAQIPMDWYPEHRESVANLIYRIRQNKSNGMILAVALKVATDHLESAKQISSRDMREKEIGVWGVIANVLSAAISAKPKENRRLTIDKPVEQVYQVVDGTRYQLGAVDRRKKIEWIQEFSNDFSDVPSDVELATLEVHGRTIPGFVVWLSSQKLGATLGRRGGFNVWFIEDKIMKWPDGGSVKMYQFFVSESRMGVQL